MPDKHENDKSKTIEKSRRAKLKEDGDERPDMPPCDMPHLIGHLFEIGPTMAGGMGDGPITNGEIESWQRNVGVELTAWEARAIRRLSIEYLHGCHEARKRDCPPPWKSEEFEVDLSGVARNLELEMDKLMDL